MRYRQRVFDFVSQMSIKPKLIADEFTDKYYYEENAHDKILYNPEKAVLSSQNKHADFKGS